MEVKELLKIINVNERRYKEQNEFLKLFFNSYKNFTFYYFLQKNFWDNFFDYRGIYIYEFKLSMELSKID